MKKLRRPHGWNSRQCVRGPGPAAANLRKSDVKTGGRSVQPPPGRGPKRFSSLAGIVLFRLLVGDPPRQERTACVVVQLRFLWRSRK